jgi:hypothetical protein
VRRPACLFFAALALALGNAFSAAAQVRFVQLDVKGDQPTGRWLSQTNELVTVHSVTVSGAHVASPKLEAVTGDFSSALRMGAGESRLGAATWFLSIYPRDAGSLSAVGWVIFRVETVNTSTDDPRTVAVVPRGAPAAVVLEVSQDLRSWSPLVLTNLPANATNQFLRVQVQVQAPAE